MWIQIWRLLILILPFDPSPSDVSKEEAGSSIRQDILFLMNSSLKQDLNGKKKGVFSIGGLLSDKDHFNCYGCFLFPLFFPLLLNGEQPRGCSDAATRVYRGIPLKAHLTVEGIGILGIIRQNTQPYIQDGST